MLGTNPAGICRPLIFQNQGLSLEFSLTFLFVNLLGSALYYVHPAAPPWYVQRFGFEFQPLTMGSTVDLEKFDRILGVHLFRSTLRQELQHFRNHAVPAFGVPGNRAVLRNPPQSPAFQCRVRRDYIRLFVCRGLHQSPMRSGRLSRNDDGRGWHLYFSATVPKGPVAPLHAVPYSR